MASTVVTKRSLRLNPCNVSGIKLRPRKVDTVNKSLKKVKTNTRSKVSHTAAKVATTKKLVSTEKQKNSSSESSVVKISKPNRERKQTKSTAVKNSITKRKLINASKKKEIIDNSGGLRQLSLQESFKHQSLPRLRPRQNKKDYCEDSILQQKYLKPQDQNSIVLIEKLDIRRHIKKIPIYKTVEGIEISPNDKNNIYDFKYDTNDTKEKLAKKKKRKKRIRKTNVNKSKGKSTKKSVREKATVKLVKLDKEPSLHADVHPIVEIQIDSPLDPVSPCWNVEPLEIDAKAHTTKKVFDVTEQSPEQINKQNAEKPKIVSVEDVNDMKIIKSSFSSSKDDQSFRSENIHFNKPTIQYKKAVNCSLLTKSLSPIMKTYDTFDFGSPWRAPTLPMFSHFRSFIQSTPYGNKVDNIHKKHMIQVKDDSRNSEKAASTKNEVIHKNLNSSMQNVFDKTTPKKNSSLNRKFGTEITNINACNNNSMLQSNNIEIISEKPVTEIEAKPSTNTQSDTIVLQSPSRDRQLSFNDTDDKENIAVNHQAPKKSPKKKMKKRYSSNLFPLKERNDIKDNVQTENVEPQPGPSGVKNLRFDNENRILRQSNLNNFLNIMDTPENTKIHTKHGIFDNTYSTTVSSAIKKDIKPVIELENAFGFCENESELDGSPTKKETAQVSTKVQASSKPKTSEVKRHNRLSLKELRNHLLPKQPIITSESSRNKQTVEQKNVKIVESEVEMKLQKQLIDVTNFSDTFDVLSESGRQSNYEGDIPLFIDLEPTHFSTPAQHSYKRKRAVTFDFSEDSGEEENKENKIKPKKKKPTKTEKENHKRLMNWVKSINSTFQEIDEHDLLIE